MRTSACGAGSTAASRSRARASPASRVDGAELQPSLRQQVRVGQVRDGVAGRWVLAELLHVHTLVEVMDVGVGSAGLLLHHRDRHVEVCEPVLEVLVQPGRQVVLGDRHHDLVDGFAEE